MLAVQLVVLHGYIEWSWAVTHDHVHAERANVHTKQARVCRRLHSTCTRHTHLILHRNAAIPHGKLWFVVLHGYALNAHGSVGSYPRPCPCRKCKNACNTSTRLPATAATSSRHCTQGCGNSARKSRASRLYSTDTLNPRGQLPTTMSTPKVQMCTKRKHAQHAFAGDCIRHPRLILHRDVATP
jgi:hypothetical protein